MARLRRLQPGTVWFVTVRCERRQFRLRPDQLRAEAVGFQLAAANAHCPGIQIHAVCQMTNHIHLVVTDTQSQLSNFMMRFNGLLARDINALDEVKGRFFERRFAASPILDLDAVVDRIVYTVCNPASANLVDSFEQWPGLCEAFVGSPPKTFRRTDRRAFYRALRLAEQTGTPVDENDFVQMRTLTLVPVPGVRPERIEAAIAERHRALHAKRGGSVLGVRAVLAVDPFDTPISLSSKRPNPLCHTSVLERLKEFKAGWRDFVDAYKQASARFRNGHFGVIFPSWTFRPFCPLIE